MHTKKTQHFTTVDSQKNMGGWKEGAPHISDTSWNCTSSATLNYGLSALTLS